MTILLCDRVDFKVNLMRRDKEGNAILLRETVYPEDNTDININVPNLSAPNFIKRKNVLLNIKTHNYIDILILCDFNVPLFSTLHPALYTPHHTLPKSFPHLPSSFPLRGLCPLGIPLT